MRVLYSPQVNTVDTISYTFDGEVITVTLNGVTDVFDFSEFAEDGELDQIETDLPIVPISFVQRENGVLSVELLNFIGVDATEEDKYPVWMEV